MSEPAPSPAKPSADDVEMWELQHAEFFWLLDKLIDRRIDSKVAAEVAASKTAKR